MNGYWLNRPEKAKSSASRGESQGAVWFMPQTPELGEERFLTYDSVNPECWPYQTVTQLYWKEGRGKRSGKDADVGYKMGGGLSPSFSLCGVSRVGILRCQRVASKTGESTKRIVWGAESSGPRGCETTVFFLIRGLVGLFSSTNRVCV